MYSIAYIAKILAAEIVQMPYPEWQIEQYSIDSRQGNFSENTLFLALTGSRQNGHNFVAEAYNAGMRSFLISEDIDYKHFTDANFIKISNVLRGVQKLAQYHREQFPNLEVIGITGSNGKTIVKEWLFQLLKTDYNIVRSPKSYNSQIGVALSVLRIRPEHNLAIFEAGISQPHEMQHLAAMIQPTLGIFTNLGTAHDEGFETKEDKMREKVRLFATAKKVICAEKWAKKLSLFLPKTSFLTWGSSQKSDFCIENMAANDTILRGVAFNRPFAFQMPSGDTAAIENALNSAVLLAELGFSFEKIAQKLRVLEPVAMRLELKAGLNGCLLINDAYSADLTSLQIALEFVAQQSRILHRTVILSDFLQTGLSAAELYAKIADLLHKQHVKRVLAIGEDIFILKKYLSQNIDFQYFNSTEIFFKSIKNSDFRNEIILLKGARIFGFERIVERLAQKIHKTVLEINLNALVHNLQMFARMLKPQVKMMAMVKASAYGNGSYEVAQLLEFHNINYLAVAYPDEGVDLRLAGIKTPILVLNPEESSFDMLYRYNLEPEIYSLSLLKKWLFFIKNCDNPPKIHLKLDTGMHRLGFEMQDIKVLTDILENHKEIEIASVFSHLAASEAAEHDAFTYRQAALFSEMYDKIAAAVAYRPLRHILNSSGIARFPDLQMDMVRLGIGLYGVGEGLAVVQTLKATISQIKNVNHSDTVGYGRNGKVQRDSRIATISIGYADGLLRGASGGRFSVAVRGKLAPTVGNVCMDMTMIDITDIPEAEEGDEVEIFGAEVPVQALAKALGTIPYEIFTTISERVQRVYFQE